MGLSYVQLLDSTNKKNSARTLIFTEALYNKTCWNHLQCKESTNCGLTFMKCNKNDSFFYTINAEKFKSKTDA